MKRILVAEDDATTRMVLYMVLKKQFEVELAVDGQQTLDLLKTKEAWDCVILNTAMPVLGGLEVLQFMKAQRQLQSVPVVVITDPDDFHLQAVALRKGAAVSFRKPFLPSLFLTMISVLVKEENLVEMKKGVDLHLVKMIG